MAEIKTYPTLKHLRSEPTMHTMQYKRGRLARSGKGLAFWFRPLSSSILEIPLDDQALQVAFHGRSIDFQDITVQGVITYRVTDPDAIADRIDFSIDLETGRYLKAPLEQLGSLLNQLSQQFVLDYLGKTPLKEIFEDGLAQSRGQITAGLEAEGGLAGLGIEIVAVRVSSIRPSAEVEKALQTPAREAIQQKADEASFSRRAMAVQKERAIEENELQNKIELAKRRELLLAQEGQNFRKEAHEKSAAKKIIVEGETERAQIQSESQARQTQVNAAAEAGRKRVLAEAEASSIEMVEGAKVEAEKERTAIYSSLEPRVLMGLAAMEAAEKMQIDHLNVGGDQLGSLLANLMEAKTKEIES